MLETLVLLVHLMPGVVAMVLPPSDFHVKRAHWTSGCWMIISKLPNYWYEKGERQLNKLFENATPVGRTILETEPNEVKNVPEGSE
jgi:hypothetical protein